MQYVLPGRGVSIQIFLHTAGVRRRRCCCAAPAPRQEQAGRGWGRRLPAGCGRGAAPVRRRRCAGGGVGEPAPAKCPVLPPLPLDLQRCGDGATAREHRRPRARAAAATGRGRAGAALGEGGGGGGKLLRPRARSSRRCRSIYSVAAMALKHGSIDGLGRGPHMSIRCQESG